MATKNREKKILIEAHRSRGFLRIHGFLSDTENTKLVNKILKYRDKNKIEVTAKELEK